MKPVVLFSQYILNCQEILDSSIITNQNLKYNENMLGELNLDFDVYSALIVPLLICISRVFDVILGTLRIVLVIQGRKILATLCGFFEVLIWICVAAQVMGQLANFVYYMAWALGFALGTYVGMILEEKISLGNVIVRVITADNPENLKGIFKSNKINATQIKGYSEEGEVDLFFAVIERKRLKFLEKLIRAGCPDALYTIESVRTAHNFLPASKNQFNYFRRVFPRGKSK